MPNSGERRQETILAGVTLLVAVVLRLNGWVDVCYVPLAIYGCRGNAQAITALGASWLLTMLSKGVVPDVSGGGLGRLAVIGATAAATMLRSGTERGGLHASRPVRATLLLGAFLAIHALLFSRVPSVSILKTALWTTTVGTLFAAWGRLPDGGHQEQGRRVFNVLGGILLVSLPLTVTEMGYFTNGTGFQGILNQPQAFGPAMALLAAWLMGNMVAEPKPSWAILGLLGITLVLVVLSQARTAGLALALGVPMAMLLSMRGPGRSLKERMPALFHSRLYLWGIIAGIALLIAGTGIEVRATAYLQKGEGEGTLFQTYGASRGSLIDKMLANIDEHPITGIGFGIASDATAMIVDRDPFLGIPTGAAVEKGVMPLAVLEELGLFGALAIASWMAMAIAAAVRGGVVPTTVLCTALLTNMGEATFFSPSGFGLLVLLVTSWAATSKGREVKAGQANA